jgi:hypothetical protein
MPRRNGDDNDKEVNPTSNWMVEEKKTLPNITTAPSTSEKGERQQQHQEDRGKSSSIAVTAVARQTEPREQKDHPSQSTTTTSFAASTATTTNTADSNPYAKTGDPMEDMMSTNQKNSFPTKLHLILNEAQRMGYEDIVSWDAKGTSFRVHKPDEFCESILVRYFRQSKYESFTRQCE